jgi:hypothetical protein
MTNVPLHTLWKSISEAGFIAGVVATVSQFLGYGGYRAAAVFVFIMIVAWVTVFNIRFFHINRQQLPQYRFVNGHDATFELLTNYVKNAEESIWVTRYSKGSIKAEREYFWWTNQRISGGGGKQIYQYRRLMSVDTPDKAELICSLIKLAGSKSNFLLRETELINFFDLLIIDGKHAIIMFHEQESHGTVNGALVISQPDLVIRFKSIYESMWSSSRTRVIKEENLSEIEQKELVDRYSRLMKNPLEPELSEESL